MYSSQKDEDFNATRRDIDRWLADPEADRLVKRRREIQYCYGKGAKTNRPVERKAITSFSAVAARRLRRYIDNYYADFTGMITLTYGKDYPLDGRVVKKHLRAFWERLRRLPTTGTDETGATWLQEYSLVWWIEYQERGAPHIHAVVTGWLSMAWVAQNWSAVSGAPAATSTRVESLRDSETAGSYAAKYAAKAEQHEVPGGYENCGRHWGCIGARPAGGGPRVPRVAAATPARTAGRLRACARPQMQVRAWNREITERAKMGHAKEEAQYYLDMPPIYIEGRCLWTVRVYEHDGGYSIYGNEREIEELWRYLQANTVTIDQIDHDGGSIARAM